MLGVVTAMETFCGQAYGARKYQMVGVVLQRALAISLAYCAGALLLWTRGTYLLVRMGQDPQIAAAAGAFTLALGPALVLDAADQCCRRYLSAQSVVQPLMVVTLLATLLTPLFLYVFVFRYKMGLLGAAVAWDLTQAASLPPSKCTWGGWTREAFEGWTQYITMAVPSMVMICE
ncbi:MATE efflux family protein [Monoraphidium neglectum]|uniref:MATE efflux family protein n=1 Tax=Monoraphidium neglectum TaxID=145388 RepID=A0A0D2KW46_9CHLO|nr:MATE efflux family protein [Monoraphidium neglectum]KIY99568.1 MATE efflux family protein [Monoraphidium neglectum]|eukprot:XP_013898588.1 MATE efflux family protein [Monoraphidium neglectum]